MGFDSRAFEAALSESLVKLFGGLPVQIEVRSFRDYFLDKTVLNAVICVNGNETRIEAEAVLTSVDAARAALLGEVSKAFPSIIGKALEAQVHGRKLDV